MYIRAVMPEGKKHWGCQKVLGGDNLPSPVGIGLTDLGPPVPTSLSKYSRVASFLQKCQSSGVRNYLFLLIAISNMNTIVEES